jgi:hypothetical protein
MPIFYISYAEIECRALLPPAMSVHIILVLLRYLPTPKHRPKLEYRRRQRLEGGQMSTRSTARAGTGLVTCLTAAAVFALVGAVSIMGESRVQAQDLDMNAIMPCGGDFTSGKLTEDQCKSARDLFLQNCTSCHSFVPVVRMQKDEAGWTATMGVMGPKAQGASPDDLNLIKQFLIDHFNPSRPVPNLPPDLVANDPGFPPA